MTTMRREREKERQREKITTTRRRGYVEPSDITIRKNVYFSNEIKHIEILKDIEKTSLTVLIFFP